MEEMTIEQALNNIQLVVEAYRGTKQEHIALEKSLSIIKSAVTPSEVSKEVKSN